MITGQHFGSIANAASLAATLAPRATGRLQEPLGLATRLKLEHNLVVSASCCNPTGNAGDRIVRTYEMDTVERVILSGGTPPVPVRGELELVPHAENLGLIPRAAGDL